jgi:hypothetical protein
LSGHAAQLHQQPTDVGLDGRFADHELVGDLGIGKSAGDQDQHLALSGGQRDK